MRVRTPAEGFSGVVAGVEFADGVGETSDARALVYFRSHGYQVDEPAKKAAAPEKKPAKKAAAKPA